MVNGSGCRVLLLLLPHLVETVPACQDTIKYCQNCSPGFDCKIENSLAGIPFSQQEATCLQILQNDANLYAVAYDPSQVDKCFTYSCEQSESITYSTGYVTYMRTCNTGCLNSSLELISFTRFAPTSQGEIIPSIQELKTCVLHLTATNAPYAIYFTANGNKLCQLSNGCSTVCDLVSTQDGNDQVVIQHCHRYLVSTSTTFPTSSSTTTTTAPTTTMTPPTTMKTLTTKHSPTTTTMPTTMTSITTTATSTTAPTTTVTPTTTMKTLTTTNAPTTTTVLTTMTPITTTTTTTTPKTTTPTTMTPTTSTSTSSTTLTTTKTTAPETTKATQTRATKPPNIYILPCICNKVNEWSNVNADTIITLLIQNLTIDKSNTTLAISKRISRSDPRASSANIGRVASSICIAIACLTVLSDCLRLCRYIQTLQNNKVLSERRVFNKEYDINRMPHIYT